jgi:hypothetical protein
MPPERSSGAGVICTPLQADSAGLPAVEIDYALGLCLAGQSVCPICVTVLARS